MEIALTRAEVIRLSEGYSYDSEDLLFSILAQSIQRGFMKRSDLVAVAKWKWRGGRTRQLASQNTESEVNEITKAAFAAKNERLRIGALLALRGVNWPMASVILHFAFPTRYPILDVRAMNTVGGASGYTFERWIEYTHVCRDAAKRLNVSMRVLDRALWAADKIQHPKRSKSR